MTKMKLKYLYIISIFAGLLLSACNEDEIIGSEDNGEAIELEGIRANIVDGDVITTRADNNFNYLGDIDNKDHVGRYLEFEAGDKLVFTSICRTTSPISDYNYSGIEYNYISTNSGSEEDATTEVSLFRNKGTGSTAKDPNTHPDKIYWSDAKNPHTFVGYACPNIDGFDWNNKTVNTIEYYYGSIGDPTITTINEGGKEIPAIIDYDNTETGNKLIKDDDILLTWDNALVAQMAVAEVKFHHGLALIRVQVSLSGFASDDQKDDIHAVASKVIFKGMPTMYKWGQQSHNAEMLDDNDNSALSSISWGTNKTTPLWNQTKDVHFWCPRPNGDAVGKTSNKFTFYALAVPRTGVNGQQVEFTVTYPKAMKPSETQPHTYKATLPNGIEFRAGHCTTININLNHANEKITIGAEYIDWQFDATPDDGSLKKNSTFLNTIDMTKVTTANETGVNIDNATWLFKGESTTIYDIYMNDGTSPDKAYQIRTAAQLLSFAEEVNTGNTFEGKFVSLDAGLYLQSSTENEGLIWPGIGTSTNPFQGTFIGGMRRISRLQGKSLFGCIGAKGHVEQVMLEDVISISTGGGALVDQNNGIISACKVTSRMDKKLYINKTGNAPVEYAGVLCGENNGMIVGCYALGEFCAYATTVGGLVGNNTGSVVASYSAVDNYIVTQLTTDVDGIDGSSKTEPTTIGGVVGNGTCTYCFYCNELITSSRGDSEPAKGMTATAMQKDSFVGSTDASNVATTTLNGAIHQWCASDTWPTGFDKDAIFSPAITDGNGTVVTPAVTQSQHLNKINFISRVASFPILDDSNN